MSLVFVSSIPKKGTRIDSHERQDVTLRKMVALGFLNFDNAPTPEAALSLPEDTDTPSADPVIKTLSYSTSQLFKQTTVSVPSVPNGIKEESTFHW